jgi:hypothetical protein
MPPTSKYGAVNIQGFFPDEKNNVAIQLEP